MTTLYLGQFFNEDSWVEELMEVGINKEDFFPSYYGKTPQDCLDHILNDPLFDEDNESIADELKETNLGTFECQIKTTNLNTSRKDVFDIIIKQYTV